MASYTPQSEHTYTQLAEDILSN